MHKIIRLPIAHLTADNRFVATAPIMAPDIACVVLTGIPSQAIKVLSHHLFQYKILEMILKL
jgi:hypothetical protein